MASPQTPFHQVPPSTSLPARREPVHPDRALEPRDEPVAAARPDDARSDPAPSLDVLARPAATPANYRSTHPRRPHPYRGAVLLALLLAGAAGATWFAAAEVLLAIEDGAARLRALDSETSRAIATTVLLASGLLSVIVAWGRATSPRRPVRLSDGRGRMAVDAIEARLRQAIVADPDVHDARVWVDNRHRRGLRVDVNLRVGPRTRIDDAIDRVDKVVEHLLHRGLGVPMDGPPMVDLTYDELDLRAGRMDGARG